MSGKKIDERQRYWKNAVNRQAESGLSIRQFCAEEGVSLPSFYAWRRRLRAARAEANPDRSERRRSESPSSGDFIPLKMLQEAGGVEIIRPDGWRVRVSGDVDVQALLQVLDALDRRSGR